MKKKTIINHHLRLIASALMLMTAMTAKAIFGTAKYDAYAYPIPSGAGKVYVSTSQTNSPNYQNEIHISGEESFFTNEGDKNFYFYAKANENYVFDYWATYYALFNAGPNYIGEKVSTSPNFTATEHLRSAATTNEVIYCAVFKKQTGLVKVESNNPDAGYVNISNPDNAIDDNVTISATPDQANGVVFLGWKKGSPDNTSYVSTQNPYSFKITNDTKGTYYACFSNPQQRVFCRLRNRKTGRFLTVYGNQKASAHTTRIDGRFIQDGFDFMNSFKMVNPEDAQGNPSSVFLRGGNPTGSGNTDNVNFASLGVAYSSVVNSANYLLNFEKTGDRYLIFKEMSYMDDYGTIVKFRSFLCDEGSESDWPVMKSNISDGSNFWDVYVLDEQTTEGAFGANTKSKYTHDGKYYTTMYAPFPYKLLDGVKAYYLPISEQSYNKDTHTAIFTEITDGIVPENTAVILECEAVQNDVSSTATVNNRLLPLLTQTDAINNNILKGYTSLNGYKVPNDKNSMYVLSSNNGELGFYHFSNDNMTPYKAYLEVPQDEVVEEDVKSTTFSFGKQDDDSPTDIKMLMVPKEDDNHVYDLSGRIVAERGDAISRLSKGVYIHKGKKYIIK